MKEHNSAPSALIRAVAPAALMLWCGMVFLSAIVPNTKYSCNAGILTWSLPLARNLGQVAFAAGFGLGRRRVSSGVDFLADPTARWRTVLR